jgi:predicted nucleic acid-binding Zn ribbon protein
MSKRFLYLGHILEDFLQQWGLQKEIMLYRLTEHWAEVVGHQIASHTAPESIRFHTLILSVDSAPWMNQLLFFRKEIIEKTNRFLKTPLIREVYFRRTTLPPPPNKGLSASSSTRQSHPAINKELATFQEGINGIEDKALQKEIRDALFRYLK